MGQFAKALDQSTHAAEVDADKAAAEQLDLGPPAFLVVPRGASSGYVVRVEAFSRFRRIVDRALRDAQQGVRDPTAVK
jgi:hypothetical protein